MDQNSQYNDDYMKRKKQFQFISSYGLGYQPWFMDS